MAWQAFEALKMFGKIKVLNEKRKHVSKCDAVTWRVIKEIEEYAIIFNKRNIVSVLAQCYHKLLPIEKREPGRIQEKKMEMDWTNH